MNRFSKIFGTRAAFALAGAAALVTGPALNASPTVDLVVGTDAVEWVPDAVTDGSFTLTIATPGGGVITSDFSNSENPYYVVDGGDGGYNYELVWNSPPIAQGRAVGSKDGEEDENGRPVSASPRAKSEAGGIVSSGYFTVENGSVVDPSLQE